MTDEELAAIKARAEAATPGPWECRNAAGTRHDGIVTRIHRVRQRHTSGPTGPSALLVESDNHALGCDQEDANTEFIAHAREDIPALLAELLAWREIGRAVADAMPQSRYTAWFTPPRIKGVTIEGLAQNFIELDAEWRAKARALLGMGEGEKQS